MRKAVQFGLLSVLTVTLLAGCGADFSADKDTVYVQKKGTVKGANIADFDKDYYDEAELSDFITDTVDTYVAKAGDGTVVIEDYGVENGIAHLYLDYAGAEDYAQFNGVEFYAGTVLDAKANGYDIPNAFTAVTDKETTWDAEGNKIVIVGQQTQVQVDGTILFVSDNASVTGKNTADVTYDILDEDAQPAYIVYK
ncbi:MAG: hypothetical protein MSA09_06535 [Lachnospiraceae bacterium]|nr:hypothetical protein [Lachnospiraceae bacterium]